MYYPRSHARISCAVLLHYNAQRLTNEHDGWEEAKEGATHCLRVLEFCGRLDPMAAQSYTQLSSAAYALDILELLSNSKGTTGDLINFPAAQRLHKSIMAALLSMLEDVTRSAPDYSREIDLLGAVHHAN